MGNSLLPAKHNRLQRDTISSLTAQTTASVISDLFENTQLRYLITLMNESPRQCMQWAYEHFPVGSQMIDCYRQKGLISKTPIPFGSKSWRGRIGLTVPQVGFNYTVLAKGTHIIKETEELLVQVVSFETPEKVPHNLIFTAACRLISTLIYYGIVKVGDFNQLIKQYEGTTSLEKSAPEMIEVANSDTIRGDLESLPVSAPDTPAMCEMSGT